MDFLFAVKLKVPVEDKSSRFIKCGRRESTRVWLGGQEAVRINILTATAASSLFGCLVMGIAANLPFALAPSMGINAYFTYTVVGYLGSGPVSFLQAPLKKKKRREKKGVHVHGAIYTALYSSMCILGILHFWQWPGKLWLTKQLR